MSAHPLSWPAPLRLYGAAADLLLGPAFRRAAARLGAQGIGPERQRERLGEATRPRPEGRLIWFHAASMGESLSVLPLVRILAERATVLVTTGTASSAAVLASRLPAGALHQFAPLDASGPVTRFLDHWRPDLAVMVESEIWPQMLRAAHARGVPLVLMNARMSVRSLRAWARMPQSARVLLGLFDRIVAQTADMRDALVALGADPVRIAVGGNMKAAAPPPPADPAELERLRRVRGDAPLWAAISTHPGEEEAALTAHRAVLAQHREARLILVPRHPERADSILHLASRRGFAATRRSTGGLPDGALHLADTLGETGLWFRLAPVVFLGGSLVPVGGHNPWEPAQCGAALLTGPLREAVAADMTALEEAGAAMTVRDADDLGRAVAALLADPARAAAMGEAGRSLAARQGNRVEEIARELMDILS
ncbi:3-deoxy-D-manno-octulosonic-acid transferase [Rubellimicrobium thermophilum DSM 16684]|uniref:3-deoxy-D-manno-octulosonic acid transferase n=1 Tax=Rubellimicrobium thermophilum DSM 16684 TaxID=1123069 RepID=S9R366_9RHOB|nr:3-deoxy-D-manno-octulosonic acid transferase [Rubellimicrobium thermophilum]EPX86362.1 3-deoxy-D-manno-octulosonic-acid transferase [Rubellimicrobium thermophilum DSM 16684]